MHVEALFGSPGAYLQAVMWRIRRLKLRARHRFAALMGHTRHAYDLWTITREPMLHAMLVSPEESSSPFVIVIDCRDATAAAVELSVRSVHACAGATPEIVLLQAEPGSDGLYRSVTDPADLPALLDGMAQAAGKLWIVPIAAGDLLSPHALNGYRQAIMQAPDAVLLYADDDLISPIGRRHTPHFKPRWTEELHRGHDFVSGSCAIAADALPREDQIGTHWPADVLSLARNAPVHVPLVLHHRASRPAPHPDHPRPLSPQAPVLPHVSVIIPTRDHVALLQTCLEGLRATRYPSLDITIIDNGSVEAETLAYLEGLERSGVQVSKQPGPFNYAAMHNSVVPSLRGPLICLLNNDIEVIDPDWLAHMAPHAMRDDIGAVGARLLYPDRTIQHAGIVIGMGGGAGHAHRLQDDASPGYFSRAHLPQRVSAVTAACLVVRKDRFEAVGGFDAQNFTVAFNDVDLCLKLNAAGWQSFYEPRACLVHHESKSRGRDSSPVQRERFASELAALKRLWSTDTVHDPYHHPELSQLSEQFVVRL
ncbi:glycosyltransferase family 2 protein [Novosphingobium olei]|uniref:glycosyltransferase family 2 protein n=1 Tax=Novosphingobium olei TaxID=2728851 RepID=UPI003086B42D|nr:glycosyltransferase family 2 protein [Novosphingobium olei]